MKKYVLTHNGKEVKIGDTLINQGTTSTPFGKVAVIQEINVTEKIIPELLEAGVIVPAQGGGCSCSHCKSEEMTVGYYVDKIADRMGWNPKKVVNHLNAINAIHPSAAFSVVLREIAIELDKKYDDHIQESPRIFVVSMLDGRITEANKAHIKNYRNFAAFRNIEDAKIACRITRDILKELFKSGK